MKPTQIRPTATGRRVASAALARTGAARLGQILVADGDMSRRDQMRILAMQNRVDARFGEILLAQGLLDRSVLYDAIARQYRVPVARFDRCPPDIRLIDAYGVHACLANGVLPWRRVGGMVVVASARPEQFNDRRPLLEALFGPVQMAITGELELHRALLGQHPRELIKAAETRVAAEESCRVWPSQALIGLTFALAVWLMICLIVAPGLAFVVLLGWTMLSLVLNTCLKLAIAVSHVWSDRAAPVPGANAPIIARLPPVSILVPLFKEREIAQRLVKRLDGLEYPRELLDICLVVEADDTVTCQTLDQVDLPDHMRQIVVPTTGLKTKPRALNYALDFCRGSIVGVYDAEDAPAPDQIMRVVQRFHERGPEIACLQGVLDFYNARSNWLSRCFTVEYAMWFRVMLPGLARFGLAIPLGGTTLFFRRAALEKLGGWDAHNVTEDADLGIRLARHGYRTELIDSVTEEEANCRFWPWIRQRSRWLKGYAMTWSVHMRNPRQLLRELGAWRFFGVQLLFLGTITQFLLAPLLWSFWVLPFGLPHPAVGMLPGPVLQAMGLAFFVSLVTEFLIGVLALRAPKHRFLIPWVPTLFFYFPMAALASYKGMLELLTKPFFWDKTAHGVFEAPDATDCTGTGAAPPVAHQTDSSAVDLVTAAE